MAHAPECSGRVYYCPRCPDLPAMTIDESFAHGEASHPIRQIATGGVVVAQGVGVGIPYGQPVHGRRRRGIVVGYESNGDYLIEIGANNDYATFSPDKLTEVTP